MCLGISWSMICRQAEFLFDGCRPAILLFGLEIGGVRLAAWLCLHNMKFTGEKGFLCRRQLRCRLLLGCNGCGSATELPPTSRETQLARIKAAGQWAVDFLTDGTRSVPATLVGRFPTAGVQRAAGRLRRKINRAVNGTSRCVWRSAGGAIIDWGEACRGWPIVLFDGGLSCKLDDGCSNVPAVRWVGA